MTARDVAVVELGEPERTLTRRDLAERAGRAATALREREVGSGDRVAYVLDNSSVVFEVAGACQLLGAYPVPVNYHASVDEIRFVLEDSGAKVVVASAAHAERTGRAASSTAAARYVARGAQPGLDDWDRALEAAAPWTRPPPPAPGAVIYTSGTTGRPKGVLRGPAAPKAAARYVAVFRDVCRMGEAPVHLVTGPLYHSAPNAFARVALLLGGSCVVLPRFDAERTLEAIERFAVTHVHLVPTMIHRLLALPAAVKQRWDLSSLRAVQHAAAPCPPEAKRALIEWWGPIVDEYYGSTEAGIVTYITAAEALARPGSVGRAIEGVRVEILDEHGTPLPPGAVGDVYVHTDASERFEYHGDAEKRARSSRGKLFTGGDMGYLDAEGHLFLVDRRADMIISGGVNIYPAEIEAVLGSHPSVRDCAVFGVPHDDWGEAVHAVVEPEDGTAPSEEELRAFLDGRIARFKVPRAFELTESLPREPSGKIFKRRLRDEHWKGRGRRI